MHIDAGYRLGVPSFRSVIIRLIEPDDVPGAMASCGGMASFRRAGH